MTGRKHFLSHQPIVASGTDHKENNISFDCCVQAGVRPHRKHVTCCLPSNGCQHMPHCLQRTRHTILQKLSVAAGNRTLVPHPVAGSLYCMRCPALRQMQSFESYIWLSMNWIFILSSSLHQMPTEVISNVWFPTPDQPSKPWMFLNRHAIVSLRVRFKNCVKIFRKYFRCLPTSQRVKADEQMLTNSVWQRDMKCVCFTHSAFCLRVAGLPYILPWRLSHTLFRNVVEILLGCLTYSSTLKMVETCSSETSVDFQRTTRRYIPKDRSTTRGDNT
jgi:hypothetical protein